MDVLAIIGSVLLGISPIVASIALLVFVILAFVSLRRIRKPSTTRSVAKRTASTSARTGAR